MISATKALAKILNALGIKFGILGPEEFSDGDSQRLAGERGLFEMMVQKNGQAFRKYKFDEIITTDPHAFNALKNQYSALGVSYPVKHYTQFLAERLEQLKPLLKNEVKAKITYHDPCYLGRLDRSRVQGSLVDDDVGRAVGALPDAFRGLAGAHDDLDLPYQRLQGRPTRATGPHERDVGESRADYRMFQIVGGFGIVRNDTNASPRGKLRQAAEGLEMRFGKKGDDRDSSVTHGRSTSGRWKKLVTAAAQGRVLFRRRTAAGRSRG